MSTKNDSVSALDNYFKLTENKTDAKTEIIAGITTFITMAYILFVNPNIYRLREWTSTQYSWQQHYLPR